MQQYPASEQSKILFPHAYNYLQFRNCFTNSFLFNDASKKLDANNDFYNCYCCKIGEEIRSSK